MTATTIKRLLIDYIEDADDKKVKAIYTLLEKDIEDSAFALSDEQLIILDIERELFLSGKSIPYTCSEAISIIRDSRD